MMHLRTIVACLCLLLDPANGADPSTSSNLRGGSNDRGDRELKPIKKDAPKSGDPLKTYIVVYKETDSTVMSIASTATYSMVDAVGGDVIVTYNDALKGAAVTLTESAVEQLKQSDGIDFIVEDTPVYLTDTASWGTDRIDQRNLPLDLKYRWENNMTAGAGVNVCVSHFVSFVLFHTEGPKYQIV